MNLLATSNTQGLLMKWILCKLFWHKWQPGYSHILQRPFVMCLHCGEERELAEVKYNE